MGRFYLNGNPVDKIPEDAIASMSERLSRTISEYFSLHPDEYLRFIDSQQRAENKPHDKKVRKRKTATL